MRYLILGFCVFAAACAGEGAGAPTSPSSSIGGAALTEATHGSELPFKGTLQATETPDPANFDLKHLIGTGNATVLGRFTLTATFLVSDVNGVPTAAGDATWTAANGDQIFADVAGTAVVDLPRAAITETHTIRGGTGRFARASGTILIERSLNLVTGVSSADLSGTISLGR
jgi:hypothetical protein